MRYRECPECHASLDPGERCTCKQEREEAERKAEAERRASVTLMLAGMKKAPVRGKKKKP
jgi:hypothetical protein